MSENMEIAERIRQQIGQGAFAMLGAHTFVAGERELRFRVRGSRKVNLIVVKLDPTDTYRVEGWKLKTRGLTCDLISQVNDIQVEQLRRIISTATGLAVSL